MTSWNKNKPIFWMGNSKKKKFIRKSSSKDIEWNESKLDLWILNVYIKTVLH